MAWKFRFPTFVAPMLVIVVTMTGCQSQSLLEGAGGIAPVSTPSQIMVPVPYAWGGEVRCGAAGCMLAAVEHENNMLALHRIDGRQATLLDRVQVGYHPDSAVWLADDLLVAAVEGTASLDVFRVRGSKLDRLQQIKVGFSPRDVMVVKAEGGRYTLLVSPYNGKEVAWVLDWAIDDLQAPNVKKVSWCEVAWHPTRLKKVVGINGPAIAAACLDDKRLIAVPESNLLSAPVLVAGFSAISRNARPSPQGNWIYVSLETGGKNARVNTETGELQMIDSPLTGSVSVAPLSEDVIIWGEDRELYLQRLDEKGSVLETRWQAVSGFATSLQLLDIDGDRESDVVVFNSGGEVIDVVYGPLWDSASQRRLLKQH